MARGFRGPMRDAWKLVLEKTSSWDSTGTFKAASTDRKYPDGPSDSRVTSPVRSLRLSSVIGSRVGVEAYAGWFLEKIAGPPTPASGGSASRNPPYADCLTTSPGGGGVEQKRPAR